MNAALLILAAERSADNRLNLVVAGLFLLAGIITITTVAYWRLTRPDRVSGGDRILEHENRR